MVRLVNRICLILCLSSLGTLACCYIVEVAGYRLPMEGWFSGFSAYALIFYGGYRITRSRLPVNPTVSSPHRTDPP